MMRRAGKFASSIDGYFSSIRCGVIRAPEMLKVIPVLHRGGANSKIIEVTVEGLFVGPAGSTAALSPVEICAKVEQEIANRESKEKFCVTFTASGPFKTTQTRFDAAKPTQTDSKVLLEEIKKDDGSRALSPNEVEKLKKKEIVTLEDLTKLVPEEKLALDKFQGSQLYQLVAFICAVILYLFNFTEHGEKARKIIWPPTVESEAVKAAEALHAQKVVAPREYNSSFAQHHPGDLKEKLDNDSQYWLVLLGVKGAGKTTTAKQVASLYDGPSLFVRLQSFKEGDSLAKILFTALPRNNQEVLKERETEFAELVLEKSARVTIVLDLTGKAALYSTVDLDKQIKALTELCGARFIVTASEGTQWMSLNEEPLRKVVFFHTLPEKIASLYYDTRRAEAFDANPAWVGDKQQKRVFMEKGNQGFQDLMKAARMKDGGEKLAETHYDGYKRDIAAVLEGTCPENHRRSFAQKFAEGDLGRDELYKVCGRNFKVIAKESNMKVGDWFAQKFVVPNIAFLPDAERRYGAQSNVVKSILMTI